MLYALWVLATIAACLVSLVFIVFLVMPSIAGMFGYAPNYHFFGNFSTLLIILVATFVVWGIIAYLYGRTRPHGLGS